MNQNSGPFIMSSSLLTMFSLSIRRVGAANTSSPACPHARAARRVRVQFVEDQDIDKFKKTKQFSFHRCQGLVCRTLLMGTDIEASRTVFSPNSSTAGCRAMLILSGCVRA